MKIIKFLLFYFFTFSSVYSQDLLPFVENFTKTEYSGDNQNCNCTQGADNSIYFANNHYFLRYNGEIWKIFKFKNKIYFQSFNELFVFSNNSIEKIRFPFQISYCYVVDNEILVASVRKGIYTMNGNKFIKKQDWSAIDNNIIHDIEKQSGITYVFTKNNGIFLASDQTLIPWKNPLNVRLKNESILIAKFINDATLVIGTALQGLYIVNVKDGTFKNINRQNAIKNNAILSIMTDKENDLWLGLDNGIAHVEINSAVNIFSDYSGILGSVYSLATDKNQFLFA